MATLTMDVHVRAKRRSIQPDTPDDHHDRISPTDRQDPFTGRVALDLAPVV